LVFVDLDLPHDQPVFVGCGREQVHLVALGVRPSTVLPSTAIAISVASFSRARGY
jgi:hypothetical protein